MRVVDDVNYYLLFLRTANISTSSYPYNRSHVDPPDRSRSSSLSCSPCLRTLIQYYTRTFKEKTNEDKRVVSFFYFSSRFLLLTPLTISMSSHFFRRSSPYSCTSPRTSSQRSLVVSGSSPIIRTSPRTHEIGSVQVDFIHVIN